MRSGNSGQSTTPYGHVDPDPRGPGNAQQYYGGQSGQYQGQGNGGGQGYGRNQGNFGGGGFGQGNSGNHDGNYGGQHGPEPGREFTVEETEKIAGIAELLEATARIRKAVKMIARIYKDATAVHAKSAADEMTCSRSAGVMARVNATVAYLEGQWREEEIDNQNPDLENVEVYKHRTTFKMSNSVMWGLHQILVNDMCTSGQFLREMFDLMSIDDRPAQNQNAPHQTWPLENVLEKQCRGKFPVYFNRDLLQFTPKAPQVSTVEFTHPGLFLNYLWATKYQFYQSTIPIGAICDDIRGRIQAGYLEPILGTDMLAALVFCYYEIILQTIAYYDALYNHIKLTQTNLNPKQLDDIRANICGKYAFLSAPLKNVPPLTAPDGNKYACTWYVIFMRGHAHAGDRSMAYRAMLKNTLDPIGSAVEDPAGMLNRITGLGIGNLDPSTLMNHPLVRSAMASFGGMIPGFAGNSQAR